MTNHSAMKLGRLPKRVDPRVPRLAMLAPQLPAPPNARDWFAALTPKNGKATDADFGMMRNDELGNCTACGVAHAYQTWTGNARVEWTAADADVVAFYSGSTGYVPGDAGTDNGGVEVDVLTYLLKHGFCGRHIEGFVSLGPKNERSLQTSIDLFGGFYAGVALPLAARGQDVWDLGLEGLAGDGAPNSWGGHCVWFGAYDNAAGWYDCITWGKRKRVTRRWLLAYLDEAYGILAGAWIAKGVNPGKFPVAALSNAMHALRVA